MLIAVFAARPAAASYLVGPAVPLEQLAKGADLVCKATVTADRPVTDPWFEKITGFEARETELRLVSILKGPADAKVVRFRHYAVAPGPTMYAPRSTTS